ncbi:hypothetical protein VPH35_039824 [Triticum aestivum]
MGRGGAEKPSEEEVIELEVKLPASSERRLDLPSDKTFLTPHLQQATQDGHQDLNLPPTASTTDVVTTTSAFYTLNMVREALERAAAARSPPHRTCRPPCWRPPHPRPPPRESATARRLQAQRHRLQIPTIRTCVCPSCFTHELIAEAEPWCPRCGPKVPPLPSTPAAHNSRKKPRIDLNAEADETE